MGVTLPYSTTNTTYGDSTYNYIWTPPSDATYTNTNRMQSSGYSKINSVTEQADGSFSVSITISNTMTITRGGTANGALPSFTSTPNIRLYNVALNSYISVYNTAASKTVADGTTTTIVHSATVAVIVPGTWFLAANKNWQFSTSNYAQCTTYGANYTHTKTETAFAMQIFDVTTVAASNVTLYTATIAGNLAEVIGGITGTKYIEYGTTTAYGYTTLSQGTGVGAFSASIDGLTRNTLYHFRAKIVTPLHVWYGVDMTFTTKTGLAILTTQAVSSIAATSAVGNATITGFDE